jgi:hypothetical protein
MAAVSASNLFTMPVGAPRHVGSGHKPQGRLAIRRRRHGGAMEPRVTARSPMNTAVAFCLALEALTEAAGDRPSRRGGGGDARQA